MKTLLYFSVLLFCFSFASSVWAQGSVSGLEFLNISADATIGDVIAAIYVYGVGFVALAALVVFTAGGVRYIFAGDRDPSEAKSWMKNAFWGLVLALTSWLILYTINPELVKNIGDLKLQTIQVTPGSEGAACVVSSTNQAEQCDSASGFECVNGKCQKKQSKATAAECRRQVTETECRQRGCVWSGGIAATCTPAP